MKPAALMEAEESKRAAAPTVSIGLPVFNGEPYLEQALDSIQAQTFRHFELVISDNGSSDGTETICRRYAAADPRIRYYRQATTRGVTWNFRQVALLAEGKYFLWMAADDRLVPNYVERCLHVLKENPSVVLCYSQATVSDENGNLLGHEEQALNAGSARPWERFRELIRMDHNCGALFGVMRADVLRKTAIHGDFADSDRCLLAELALYGTIHQIPEPLFFHREHDRRVTRMYPSRRERMWKLFPEHPRKIVFPYFRQFREYILAIRRAPLSHKERLRCYLQMLGWLKDNRKRLARDLKFALRQAIPSR